MISVIIPTYNRAEYLKQAIDSVLAQTFKAFEIIVVDDASTDNTKDIISAYGDRVRYVYQDNKERAAARNRGIAAAEGKFVAFLDSDDIWMPAHLSECYKTITKNKRSGFVYSGSYSADEKGRVLSRMKAVPLKGDALYYMMSEFSSGGCNASSCLIKKELFDTAGYFNEDRELSGSEDWEMWVRAASAAEVFFTGRYTVKIRNHDNQTSVNTERMARSMTKAMETVYENKELLPRIAKLKKRAYSSVYVIISINYYAAGDMRSARGYLRKAVVLYPLCVILNKYVIFTLIRSFMGKKVSFYLRKKKGLINYFTYGKKYT